MPARALLVVPLTLVAFAPLAAADSMTATLGEPLDEVSHDVSISVRDGVATMTVQRVFSNAGSIPDEAVIDVQTPQSSAAIGLRIKAGRRWFRGDLLAADEAIEKYAELTGHGAAELRDPALLSWSGPDQLQLRVFPVPPGKTATVQYILTAPVEYRGGKQIVSYPRRVDGDKHLVAPVVRVGNERVIADASEDGGAVDIAVAPSKFRVARGRLGVVEASKTKQLARFALEAAPAVSKMPSNLGLVFVIDTSVSVGFDGVLDALAIVDAVAARAPGAKIEIVAFSRRAHRAFGELVPVEGLDAALIRARADAELDVGNGSNLELGLSLAADVVAKHRGPSRIIAITDGWMRTPFSTALANRFLRRLVERSVVHLVIPGGAGGDDYYADSRSDDHDLAPIALSHRGVLIELDTEAEAEAIARSALGLVRPIRIDSLRVTATGMSEPLIEVPFLAEGESTGSVRWYQSAPTSLRARGMLWSAPWERKLSPSKRYSRAAAAFAAGAGYVEDLTDDEMEQVADYGHAVSPVTSYLAIEPGVQPSIQGLDWGEGAYGGLFGDEIGEMYGTGSACGPGETPPNLSPIVDELASRCLDQHQVPDSWRRSIAIEITGSEIVDVAASGRGGDPALSCVIDAIWDEALPGDIASGQHRVTVAVAARPRPAP